MPIIIIDTVVAEAPRSAVLAWLSEASHHEVLLRAGFTEVHTRGPGTYEAVLRLSRLRAVNMGYRFLEVDSRHGGRRVRVKLSGRRTTGSLSLSLRSLKPDPGTLVTLHADYRSGRLLGPIFDILQTKEALKRSFKSMLDALEREVDRS